MQVNFPSFSGQKVFNERGELIPNYVAITNDKTQQTVSMLSRKYAILNHEDAFDLINPVVQSFSPGATSEVIFNKTGSYMKIAYDLPEQYNLQVAEGDSLKTRIVGFNSVDGTRTLMFGIEFLRLVCLNGLRSFSREWEFSKRHTQVLLEDVETEEYGLRIAAKVQTALETMRENSRMLINSPIEYKKGMELIKELVNRKLIPQKLEGFVEDFWTKAANNQHSKAQENGSSLWTLYNGLTASITHHQNNRGNSIPVMQKDLLTKNVTNFVAELAKAA